MSIMSKCVDGDTVSALAVRRCMRSMCESVGLVEDLGVDGAQGWCVGAPMVGTEQQFAATGEDNSQVGARSAAVATVGCGQVGWSGGRCHVRSPVVLDSSPRVVVTDVLNVQATRRLPGLVTVLRSLCA